MKNIACLIALAVVFAVGPSVSSQADEKKPAVPKKDAWMKQKLQLSQNILAGLTEADFDKISTNATSLNVAGHLEKWIAAGKPKHKDYELHRNNFDFYNRDLIRQARDKNIEGATLAYQLMTASCIECHKIVRDVKK
jgi:hypothetical protein